MSRSALPILLSILNGKVYHSDDGYHGHLNTYCYNSHNSFFLIIMCAKIAQEEHKKKNKSNKFKAYAPSR